MRLNNKCIRKKLEEIESKILALDLELENTALNDERLKEKKEQVQKLERFKKESYKIFNENKEIARKSVKNIKEKNKEKLNKKKDEYI